MFRNTRRRRHCSPAWSMHILHWSLRRVVIWYHWLSIVSRFDSKLLVVSTPCTTTRHVFVWTRVLIITRRRRWWKGVSILIIMIWLQWQEYQNKHSKSLIPPYKNTLFRQSLQCTQCHFVFPSLNMRNLRYIVQCCWVQNCLKFNGTCNKCKVTK